MVSRKVNAYVSLSLFFGVIVALIAGLNGVTVWKWHRIETLRNAPTVEGRVQGRYASTSTRGTPSYSVRYSYEVTGEDGESQSFEVSRLVEPDVYDRATEGGVITVHYLPSSPRVSAPAGTPYSLSYWVLACVVIDGIFLLWVVRIAWSMLKSRKGS